MKEHLEGVEGEESVHVTGGREEAVGKEIMTGVRVSSLREEGVHFFSETKKEQKEWEWTEVSM